MQHTGLDVTYRSGSERDKTRVDTVTLGVWQCPDVDAAGVCAYIDKTMGSSVYYTLLVCVAPSGCDIHDTGMN